MNGIEFFVMFFIIRTEVTVKELREAREALGTWLHDSIEKERTNDANP